MEQILEKNIRNRSGNMRIIGDLDLSKDDYKYLRLKLKGIIRQEADLILIEKYKLSIITGQVFAFLYESEEKANFKVYDEFISKLNQYQVRAFLTIISEAFCDMGIETFGINGDTLVDLYEVAGMHVGLKQTHQNDFFALLDESLDYFDIRKFEDKISDRFLVKGHYKYINKQNLERMFAELRELFIDCKVNNLTKDILYQKYPVVSNKLILSCHDWCKAYSTIEPLNRKALSK